MSPGSETNLALATLSALNLIDSLDGIAVQTEQKPEGSIASKRQFVDQSLHFFSKDGVEHGGLSRWLAIKRAARHTAQTGQLAKADFIAVFRHLRLDLKH